MLTPDDAAESAKALSLLVQTLLKVREALGRKPDLDPDLDKFLDLVTQAISMQADLTDRIVDIFGRHLDHIDELTGTVQDLVGEVADLRQKVAEGGG